MIEEKDKKKIIKLYFNECLKFDEIVEAFKGKYTYRQIKYFILEYIEKW